MEINKISNYLGQQVGKTRPTESKPGDSAKTGSRVDTARSGASDHVAFSKEYQEINKVKKVTMELEDIRTERVDHLRTMINSGNYTVEPGKVADKMLEEIR